MPSVSGNSRRTRSSTANAPLDLDKLEKKYGTPRVREEPAGERVFGLREAPTFRPTREEFASPLSYIQQISRVGKKYGIAKIVPPDGWRPPFAVDTQTFTFKSRKQELNEMNCIFRERSNYLEQLYRFHTLAGTDLGAIPTVAGKQADFYLLKKALDGEKSKPEVFDWRAVARRMAYAEPLLDEAATVLQQVYERVLEPYAVYVVRAKSNLASVQITNEKVASAMIARGTGTTGGNRSTPKPTKSEEDTDSAEPEAAEKPKIGADEDSADGSKPSTPGRKRQRKRAASKDDVKQGREFKPGEKCEVCRKGDHPRSIILCDECDKGFHMGCLNPPITKVPASEWFCDRCVVGTGEFGFEDGSVYTLRQFEEKADRFKSKYFSSFPKEAISGLVSEYDVEKEYWRLMESSDSSVEVEYGADIHSTIHGSAFPTLERQPLDPYAVDEWNLNIMPMAKDSLLRYIKNDISGMTIPWVYVGMCFSTFCWHNEDHHTYSVNYQHLGDTKTWYGVPGDYASNFESTMKKYVPDLFDQQPDLLFQLVTMMSPGKLLREGVPVYALDQHPNEFVITFPRAYHAGFNHGFNVNEAVNFATSDWASEGFSLDSVVLYSNYKRTPCFSHDELICTTYLQDSSVETSSWLAPLVKTMVNTELERRKEVQRVFPDIKVILVEEDLTEAQYQCAFCNVFTYLSQVTTVNNDFVLCAKHCKEFPREFSEKSQSLELVLRLRYADETLEKMESNVSNRAEMPRRWQAKFEHATSERLPSLKLLRGLVTEGEKIHVYLPELAPLRKFVEHANKLIEDATAYIAKKHVNRRKNEFAWRKSGRFGTPDGHDEEGMMSFSAMTGLLQSLQKCGIDSPEVEILGQKIREAQCFIEEANAKLTDSEIDLNAWKQLAEQGQSLHLDLPQCNQISRHVSQLEWIERFNDTYGNKHVPLETLRDIRDAARSCGISPASPYLKRLETRIHVGEQWDSYANQLLQGTVFYLEPLYILIDSAERISFAKKTLERLEFTADDIKESWDILEDVLKRAKSADPASRPSMLDVQDFMVEVEKLPPHMKSVLELNKLVRQVTEWSRKGKKLFGKTNASSETMEQLLATVITSANYSFSLSDEPKMASHMKEEGNQDQAPALEDEKGKELFCFCRMPENGVMIECEECHEWYHIKCLKLSKKRISEESVFTCAMCDWTFDLPRTLTRPRVEDLLQLSEAAKALPFKPTEAEALNELIETCRTFQAFLSNNVLSDSATLTRFTLRHYMRKLEGAPVLFAHDINMLRSRLHADIRPPQPLVLLDESKGEKKSRKRRRLDGDAVASASPGPDTPMGLAPVKVESGASMAQSQPFVHTIRDFAQPASPSVLFSRNGVLAAAPPAPAHVELRASGPVPTSTGALALHSNGHSESFAARWPAAPEQTRAAALWPGGADSGAVSHASLAEEGRKEKEAEEPERKEAEGTAAPPA